MSEETRALGARRQGGPPLVLLAAVSTGLLVAALAVSAALGGTVPSPFSGAAGIAAYFRSQPDAVRASGVLVFASSVPLAIYGATASARLRQLGVLAPGATIAQGGGLLSASALGLSGLLQWVLARPAVRGDIALVRALHDLAFLTGGPGSLVPLGLLVAGIAVPGLLLHLLPRPLALTGLLLGGLAELTALTLLWPDLSPLLPAARFPALAWLVIAGRLLPQSRPRRTPASTATVTPGREQAGAAPTGTAPTGTVRGRQAADGSGAGPGRAATGSAEARA